MPLTYNKNKFLSMEDSTVTINLPETNTFEENVQILAEEYNKYIQSGHGLFINLEATPEYQKPVMDCLAKKYDWTIEKPYFARKP